MTVLFVIPSSATAAKKEPVFFSSLEFLFGILLNYGERLFLITFNTRIRRGCDILILRISILGITFNTRIRRGCDISSWLIGCWLQPFNTRIRIGCDVTVSLTTDVIAHFNTRIRRRCDHSLVAMIIMHFQHTHPSRMQHKKSNAKIPFQHTHP